MRIIDLVPLGLTDYSDVDALQRDLHEQATRGEADSIIVAQFTPTWTAGRHTKPEDIPNSSLPVIHVDRAGSATWHGPGQLVVYPNVRLKEPVDVYAWIRSVENGVLVALREEWALPVERIDGRAGVWLRTEGRRDRKICAIGLKVARGATLHGIALNVDIDPSSAFSGIIPCGLTDADVASLSWEGIHTDVPTAAARLIPHLVESIRPQLADSTSDVEWVRPTSLSQAHTFAGSAPREENIPRNEAPSASSTRAEAAPTPAVSGASNATSATSEEASHRLATAPTFTSVTRTPDAPAAPERNA